jgi:ABC-type glycerol-3-phosphate transport system substrate-binding protein
MKHSLVRFFAFTFLVSGAFLLAGCGEESAPPYRIDLEVWGVFDDSSVYRDILAEYKKLNETHVGGIDYRKKTQESYREDLLSAFAEGNGPDVFLIRNAWLPEFKNLIEPAPADLVSEKEFRDAFPDVVVSDFLVDGKVYGVPLSVDSLALYYNKDILNAAGITAPPETWEALLDDTRLLNEIDFYGNINQSAVAMGTAKNVNRSTDILLALAFQKGVGSVPDHRDAFSDTIDFSDSAMRASMDFYAQFARASSPYYSWNPNQHYSLDTFYEGKLGMMINYSWHIDTIRRKNAKLNFGVAPLPQFSGGTTANMANYWTLVVAKHKEPQVDAGRALEFPVDRYDELRVAESWQMLRYLALPHPEGTMTLRNFLDPSFSIEVSLESDPARRYLEETGQPAARRDLLEEQRADAWLSPFAYGNLIAKSWRTPNIDGAEGALADAIESIVYGERTVNSALSAAVSQISALK